MWSHLLRAILQIFWVVGDLGLIGASSVDALGKFGLVHFMTILESLGAILEAFGGVLLLLDPRVWAALVSWGPLGAVLGLICGDLGSLGSSLRVLPTTPAR